MFVARAAGSNSEKRMTCGAKNRQADYNDMITWSVAHASPTSTDSCYWRLETKGFRVVLLGGYTDHFVDGHYMCATHETIYRGGIPR